MVVAVRPVGVVQVAEHQVVGVVAVGDRVVAAARAVDVVGLVGAARVVGRTGRGVRRADRERVVVDVVAVCAVEVAVVEVVDVAVVLDGLVAAARAVSVLAVVVVVLRAVVTRVFAVVTAAGTVRVAVVVVVTAAGSVRVVVVVIVSAAGSVYVSAHGLLRVGARAALSCSRATSTEDSDASAGCVNARNGRRAALAPSPCDCLKEAPA